MEGTDLLEQTRKIHLAIVRCGALGRQHHLRTLLRFLVARGYRVTLLSLQASPQDVLEFQKQVKGVDAIALGEWQGNRLKSFAKGGLALRRALKQLEFDVFYVIDSWTLRYVFVATMGAMRWPKKPFVYHTYDMLAPWVARAVDLALEGVALHKSSLNVNADRSRAAVAQSIFRLGDVPLVLPVRTSISDSVPIRDPELRRSITSGKVSDSDFLVVLPTGLSAERLSRESILAFSRLPARYHLITIDGAGKYAEECHALIREAGLSDKVTVLSPMSHERLQRVCACADLGLVFHDESASLGNYLCHPSRLAYFVAMGIPIVGNDVPNLESTVYRYGLGECCVAQDASAIADAIISVCEGSIPLERRRRDILSAYERELNFEQSAGRLDLALQHLVA